MRGLLICIVLTAFMSAVLTSCMTAWLFRTEKPPPRITDDPAFQAISEQKVKADCRALDAESTNAGLVAVILKLKCDMDERRRDGGELPGGVEVPPGDLIPKQAVPVLPPVAIPAPRELGIDPQ